MSRPNILYRCFSERGMCLYIGMTTQPGVRLRKHAEGKDWWSDVSTIELEHYRSKGALEKAEKAAILAAAPVHNVHSNPGREESLRTWLLDLDDEDLDDEPDEDDYVLVEYDGPEVIRTPARVAASQAIANLMEKFLSGVAS